MFFNIPSPNGRFNHQMSFLSLATVTCWRANNALLCINTCPSINGRSWENPGEFKGA
ncbi:MAG: hypothetical protein R6X34_09485 [Chloroflexota bacterium]